MNLIRNCAAIALTSGVAVASLSAPAVAAKKPLVATSPASAAVTYLTSRLEKNHGHLVDIFKHQAYADDGETADAILSLDAAGVGQKVAAKATAFLEKDAANYAGAVPNVYPGSAGKLLLVAEAQHINPKKFGGLNLIDAITQDEGAGADGVPGQYQNAADTMYSASIVNQSLAMVAIAHTSKGGDQPDSAAVSFLSGQQCTDGGFQNTIRPDPSAACSSEDVDTTSYAVQALLAAGAEPAASSAAVTWIKDAANTDGGYPSTVGDASEANSTALATEALVAYGASAHKPIKWLRGAQLGCSSKASQRGAVTFQGSYTVSTAERATSQAGVALAGATLTSIDNKHAVSASPVIRCSKKK